MKTHKTVMWVFCFVILIGIVLVYQSIEKGKLKNNIPIFQSKIDSFTQIALSYKEQVPSSFCKTGGGYKVNGNFFNIKKNAYFIGGGPLGGDTETTYENLLKESYLTDDMFKYYKGFLDNNSFVECIKGTISSNYSSVEFSLPNSFINGSDRGFMYVFAGNPVHSEYKELHKLDSNSNWYAFARN